MLFFPDTDFIPTDQNALVRAGNVVAQNASIVTAGLRAMHQAGMGYIKSFWGSASDRSANFIYNGNYTVNDELFSEQFAQDLWDMPHEQNKFSFTGLGVAVFAAKGWTSIARPRTFGLYASLGITDPIPTAMFRWEQRTAIGTSPIISNITFQGENAATDPIGVKTTNVNRLTWINVAIRFFRNIGKMHNGIVNSDEWNTAVVRCGLQPTAYGGPGWLPGNAKFSATSAGATTNVTSSVDVFDARHVGKNLMIETAGPYKSIFRSEITSFVDARNVVLADPCPYDMTDVAASFEVLTCNTMASSVTIDIPDMPAIDLVGRYVFLWVPGSGDNNRDLLTTRIIAQGPTTVTVAHTPAAAVAELPFILAPAEFIGVTEDEVGRGVEGSDDYQVWGQRNERSNDCGMGRLRQHHHNPRPERCIGG